MKEEFDIGVVEIINQRYVELTATQQPGQVAVTQTLTQLIQALQKSDIIRETTLKIHLEEAVLINSGLMDARQFASRRSKAITQQFFEQQKYNLLREESEGFAKIQVELNQPNITMENVKIVEQNLAADIGYFNIDPNRVLDLILDSFMNNLWNRKPYI